MCSHLDEDVAAFRDRPLADSTYSYVFHDAPYCTARVGRRADSTESASLSRMLTRSHPQIADMLEDAKNDILTFCEFPTAHWRQVWSTNPLERVNKEAKHRTDVVGVFPNPSALLRLAGAVLIEQHDEREAGDRRYFSEASMLELATMNPVSSTPVEEVTLIPELTAA